jgi:hypothetical protein
MIVNFTEDELKYLAHVLHCASPFTINRGTQVIVPGINHNDLKTKINNSLETCKCQGTKLLTSK